MKERINKVKKISRNKANRQRYDGGSWFGEEETAATDGAIWMAGK